MQNRILFLIVALLMVSMFWIPAFSWVYPDGSEDTLFECYGPRTRELLIHLYEDTYLQLDALKNQEIDIIDFPLSETDYESLKSPVYNETIQTVNYGPELDLYILDLNSNNNEYLGNPPDPQYPNPVYPNPMSSVYMRRAIAYLVDRQSLIERYVGEDLGHPMYTTVQAAMSTYLLEVEGDPEIPWAWKYDPAAANATLEEGGFKINPATGYRYWDLDNDDFEDPDEHVELRFCISYAHPPRLNIAFALIDEMANLKLRVEHIMMMLTQMVFGDKNFHMYIGGWNLGADPDHLMLWSWDYYWHPGFCFNYAGHNIPEFNEAAEGIMNAINQSEAVSYAMVAQYQQAYWVLSIPVYCNSGVKAFHKTNVGSNPEDVSEGKPWGGVANTIYARTRARTYGVDNYWSFMNMHTIPSDGGTVIDWGLHNPELRVLNPIYASWFQDWTVLDKIYDSLLVRSANDPGELLPWMGKARNIGTYMHPEYGECTKIIFSLRDDVAWSDGTPLTAADVHFTFVELWDILSSRGFPKPWWLSRIESLIAFSILDTHTFEALLDTKSFWVATWVGCNIVLPKHIWKSIAETGDPQGFQPDSSLIGSGPWKFAEYDQASGHVLLEANSGFHRFSPIALDIEINPEGRRKFAPETGTPITVNLENLCLRGSLEDLDIYITIEHPNGTEELHDYTVLSIAAGEKLNRTIEIVWKYGLYRIHVSSSAHVFPDGRSYLCHCTALAYVTRARRDISGSTYYDDIDLPSYPYKDQLPTPDFKTDMKDIGYAAKAFGSYPGHERWNSLADINADYRVDMRDIASIARHFGETHT